MLFDIKFTSHSIYQLTKLIHFQTSEYDVMIIEEKEIRRKTVEALNYLKHKTKQKPQHILGEIQTTSRPGLEVIKLEFILRLKIKHNDWLLADTCPQAANHCALF